MPSSRPGRNTPPEAGPAPARGRRTVGPHWRLVCLLSGLAWMLLAWGSWPLVWHLVLKPSIDHQRPGLAAQADSPGAGDARMKVSLRLDEAQGSLAQPDSTLRAHGVWLAPVDGEYVFRFSCDDEGELKIDGRTLIELKGVNANNFGEDRVFLEAGPHLLQVKLANVLERGWFKVGMRSTEAQDLELPGPASLRHLDLGNFDLWARLLEFSRSIAGLGLGGPALLLLFLGLGCLGLGRTAALWAGVALTLAGATADVYLQRGQELTRRARQGSTVLEVMFNLERYLESPAHRQAKERLPGLFLVGDSSHTFFPDMPDSMLNLTREVARERGLDRQVEIYGAAQPGFHAYDFYLLMNRIAPERPRLMVMPVNARTFGKISHMHWFDDLYGYLLWSELINPSGLSSTVRPLPWGSLLTAKLEASVMRDKGLPFLLVVSHVWRGLQDDWENGFKKWAGEELGLERWVGPPQDKSKGLLPEWVDIEPDHHLFPVYRRINRLARASGITVIYYAVPLNLESTSLPPVFMRDSYATIRKQLDDPPAARFLDLSTLDVRGQFVDSLEHFTPQAKRDLAAAILDYSQPLLVED